MSSPQVLDKQPHWQAHSGCVLEAGLERRHLKLRPLRLGLLGQCAPRAGCRLHRWRPQQLLRLPHLVNVDLSRACVSSSIVMRANCGFSSRPGVAQMLDALHVVRHSPPASSAPGVAATRPLRARALLRAERALNQLSRGCSSPCLAAGCGAVTCCSCWCRGGPLADAQLPGRDTQRQDCAVVLCLTATAAVSPGDRRRNTWSLTTQAFG